MPNLLLLKDAVDKFMIAKNYKEHLDAVGSDRRLESYLEAGAPHDCDPREVMMSFSCQSSLSHVGSVRASAEKAKTLCF